MTRSVKREASSVKQIPLIPITKTGGVPVRFLNVPTLIAAVAPISAPSLAAAADSDEIRVAELVRTLSSRTKTAEDRAQAAERLKEEDVAVVLPAVLAELEKETSQGDGLAEQYG